MGKLLIGVSVVFVAHLIAHGCTLSVSSLQWESFEQYWVWQLLNAEGPDPNLVIPALANMNTKGKVKCNLHSTCPKFLILPLSLLCSSFTLYMYLPLVLPLFSFPSPSSLTLSSLYPSLPLFSSPYLYTSPFLAKLSPLLHSSVFFVSYRSPWGHI